MLTVLLGTDWISNSDAVLQLLAQDVKQKKPGGILIVPELISHETERRLSAVSGDTASRFAEVLPFTRLVRRVSDYVGKSVPNCLDKGGRVVAMASATRHLHSVLKAYAAVETRPEFLTGLVDAVDEFKRCCISPADLLLASKQTEGSFAQKLEELSLILESYDALCAQGNCDPRDQINWLLEQLEDSTFAQNHTFYIDGFPDLTRQHMAVLEHLIASGTRVVVAFTCDHPDSKTLSFEKAGETAGHLIRFAKHMGISCEIRNVAPRKKSLHLLREKLFQGSITPGCLRDSVSALQLKSAHDECVQAAERILQLVQKGCRYRDISVVCADMDTYGFMVRQVFQRCGIPAYLSGTEPILEKSVITTVLSAMDAALDGFEQRQMLRYLKSVLSPLEPEICDEMENYVFVWNITGTKWLQDWQGNPSGLSSEFTDEDRALLEKLNSMRKMVVEPLVRMRSRFREARCIQDQVIALYRFMEQINLAERLDLLARQLDAQGDNREAQILNQLWEILICALEQLHDVLGQTGWDTETFVRLIKLLLSQYDVGTIPPVLDAVTVGPVSAMRCQRSQHLIVLGAHEGNLPGYGGSTGVLSDPERVQLRMLGVPLTGGASDGVQAEFSEIHGVFCGAQESVSVSCSAAQPSFVFQRLAAMAGGVSTPERLLGAALTDPFEAGALFARINDRESAASLGLETEFDRIITCKNHSLGFMQQDQVRGLYGKQLRLSASQIDTHAMCRMCYYLKYGLRLKERKIAEIDPAEFGTYVHAVLENTVKKIMELGGFRAVTLEETLRLASGFSQEYARQRFQDLDSQRLTYLFQRNSQELEMIVRELWQEMQESAFLPVGFEVAFGEDCEMPAVAIHGTTMEAWLRGFVDRVDLWRDQGSGYFRVVDYKTGKKDFDYCDVFNGIGLQMLLYLFSLESHGKVLFGTSAKAAGVQYFPARAPLVSVDGVLSDEEAEQEREKYWKRKGLLLAEEEVLLAMENAENPKRLCCKRKKDGTLSGDLATAEQFRMLKSYIFLVLQRMVDEIASGRVAPNPYTRGTSHNACRFCPYAAVCHPDEVPDRRNYKTMSAQRFWEEIEKEVKRHG